MYDFIILTFSAQNIQEFPIHAWPENCRKLLRKTSKCHKTCKIWKNDHVTDKSDKSRFVSIFYRYFSYRSVHTLFSQFFSQNWPNVKKWHKVKHIVPRWQWSLWTHTHCLGATLLRAPLLYCYEFVVSRGSDFPCCCCCIFVVSCIIRDGGDFVSYLQVHML